MDQKDTALRKRTQIRKTNRMMLLWIAIASVVVGSALVVSFFLVQKLFFNERVLGEKEKTMSTLENNNKAIPDLKDQIRVLDTNAALATVKANPNDQALQVILDALPSDANSLALGSSLQYKLLAGIPNLSIESLQVDPVIGVEVSGDAAVEDASQNSVSSNQITFQFSVTGDQAALKQVLTNLERSIRAIDITSLRIENQGALQLMSVQGRAFYEPAKSVELYDKAVK